MGHSRDAALRTHSVSLSLSSSFGFLGLCAYCLTLLPTCTRIIFPKFGKASLIKGLTQYRRQVGISVFILSVLHGGTWLYTSGVNIFQWQVIPQCWHGLSCLGIFSLLAVTSNNWSIKTMKRRWKQLHKLTYVALFILTIHIWEKTAYRWSIATPFSRGILISCIALVCLRFYWQWRKKSNSLRLDKSREVSQSSQAALKGDLKTGWRSHFSGF